MFLWRCSPVQGNQCQGHQIKLQACSLRIAGNFVPLTPTIPSLPTLPLRRRSNKVSPTTPTFLSEPEAPPPTKPVVYSPVPTFSHYQRATSVMLGLRTYHQHVEGLHCD
jgi:hypothetical protein